MALLGRAAEQETVARLLASARLGRGGALVLAGEPGVGKTALLADALDRAGREPGSGAGVRVLAATPAEVEQDLPFAALQSLLLPALRLLDDIPAPQAAELGAALSLRSGGGRDRFAIGAATLSLLSRYAEDGPVVVVLDDVHWADRPSVDALVFAARRVRDDPIAVLVAGRSGELPEAVRGLPTIDLAGLAPDAAALLLAAAFPAGPAREPDALYRETGGNPLALLELAAEPADDATAGGDTAGLPHTLPARLQRAFARRLETLPGTARAVALVAALSGGDLRLTRATCRRLDLDPAGLDDAERDGLLTVGDGHVAFRHPLLRSVVYGATDREVRRRAHLALADELAGVDADRRAWHLAAAATGLDEGVAKLLDGVGARAAERTAFTVAATALERGARLSPEPENAHARLVAAARAAWAGGQPARALALLDEAEPPAGTRSAAGAALRATVAMRAGSVRDGLDLLERAADLASPDDQVLLLAEACRASMYLVDTAALRRVEERLDAALPRVTDPVSQAVGLASSGASGVLLGRDATSRLRDAVALLAEHADPLAHPAALPWIMLAPLFLRDADAGAELRALVDEVRSRVGVGALPDVLFHVARDQATTDAWERAAANYDEAARLARETGQGGELAMALAGLAWLDSRAGRGAACREHAADAARLCRERSMLFGLIWSELALGDLELSEGESRAAAVRLTTLASTLDELGVRDPDLHPGPELVDALLRTGRDAEAREVAERFAEAAEATGRAWTRGRAERALGLVAADDGLDERFENALAWHGRTRDVFERARTRLAFGMRLRRSGRRVDARVHLRDALGTFDDLGAQVWAATTRTELEATGEKVAPREGVGPGALTPQELQVCLLLAEGRTTRETAAALFLSPKTVEYHLRKVYTRLGIHSREELAVVLRDAR
ncbi:helix-turn-helix transcriptional regulator [Cellulosimicrobium protaetiae]|uniref:helix-turn-helix transcriptional regulator n=1 Tax=Cellulosimicrobium protaetiae TaxID=2587808 RepID=UPI001C121238|nr:LuxR family transcriptional regulator [Cellulosimicrobium protaetiae]